MRNKVSCVKIKLPHNNLKGDHIPHKQKYKQDMAHRQSLMKYAEAELKLIRDMRRRNPTLGMIELWHRLRQRGYTRCPESLFRVMRKMSLPPAKKPKKQYKPKPYEQMTHPGERVQVNVKVVPRVCIADPELRLFQYSTLDDFARQIAIHNHRSNNLPMRPLHWLSPVEFAVQYV